MKITKFGHCCLLIEEGGARILLDPGSYSDGQNDVKNINAILITHEHQDHIDLNSVKAVLKNNPDAKIITNPSVRDILAKEGIESEALRDGQSTEVKGVKIEGKGNEHAVIHSSIPIVRNTGYFVAERFFYPGDALTLPNRPVSKLSGTQLKENVRKRPSSFSLRPVEILAMPASAPWARIGELIDYAIAVKPKVAFPVHDGMLKNPLTFYPYFTKILESAGIAFKPLELGKEYEFK